VEHAAWKISQIGPERFEALRLRANTVKKVDKEEIRIFIREKLLEVEAARKVWC
jgi:hypothetical protein